MGIDSKHPLYSVYSGDWVMMRDMYAGERVVKAKGTEYLPATAGMELDGMGAGKVGQKNYDAYKARALFNDFVSEGVESLIGLLHRKPPSIELPSQLEPLRERATLGGESLELLLRRINVEQLVAGRVGLLADLPATPDQTNPIPYVATYIAEAVINWDDGAFAQGINNLNLVVLNESGFERDSDFQWVQRRKYRVLQLGDLDVNEASLSVYKQGVFIDDLAYNPTAMTPPMIRGQHSEEIPFVFVNSKDIVTTPDDPPLLGLGYLALAIYRAEADYRQNLYMQGQDTLVTIGGVRNADGDPNAGDPDAIRTGAGSRIDLEMGGDAKYIGVGSEGLREQRESLNADKKKAESKAGQLVNAAQGNQESGEALKTRISAQTATLNQIAKAGAAGLEQILRKIAVWVGADPEKVKVTPNLEFADFNVGGQELSQLMTAKGMGLPLSNESIHGMLVEKGLTKLDYQAEIDLISEEDAGPVGTTAGGTPGLKPEPEVKPELDEEDDDAEA